MRRRARRRHKYPVRHPLLAPPRPRRAPRATSRARALSSGRRSSTRGTQVSKTKQPLRRIRGRASGVWSCVGATASSWEASSRATDDGGPLPASWASAAGRRHLVLAVALPRALLVLVRAILVALSQVLRDVLEDVIAPFFASDVPGGDELSGASSAARRARSRGPALPGVMHGVQRRRVGELRRVSKCGQGANLRVLARFEHRCLAESRTGRQ